jgi:competence protein ComEC
MLFKWKYGLRVALCLLILFAAASCVSREGLAAAKTNRNPNYSKASLLAHYIDVGQGDSVLIQINNKNLLIDAGPKENAEKVLLYLRNQGVNKLNYVVATHPHEDHIGGMAAVIKKFSIGDFYAPKKVVNSNAFEEMVHELKRKKLQINVAKAGVQLDLGEGVTCEIIAPISNDYENINNYSVIVRILYRKNSFLFTGDAEELSEKEIIESGRDITADILKIAHHGSSSSSTKEFLDRVSPTVAVISCGRKNNYGHPHKETLQELKKRGITIYRTDINRDILLISDGSEIIKK